MKKVIAILVVMIAIAGAVFAANNDQLQITATVNTVNPIFQIFGGKTSTEAAGTTYQGNSTPTSITYTENLADTDIVLYVRLYQSNKAKYKGTATLTITATPLVNTDTSITGGKTSSAAPAADHITATSVNGITYGQNAAPSSTTTDGNRVVTFAPIYDGRAIQATNIGTFDLTWGKDDDLAAGTYRATIKLEYTPQ